MRQHLVAALEADLVGPFEPGRKDSIELLPLPPSRWYLTGFLAPQEGRDPEDPTDDDEMGGGDDEDDAAEAGAAESEPKRPNRLPASMGLSVLLPEKTTAIAVTVIYSDYVPEPAEDDGQRRGGSMRLRWRRSPSVSVPMTVPLDAAKLAAGLPVPNSRGLELRGQIEDAKAHGLPPGTRALALFLVNRRTPGEKGRVDEQFAFQVQLELRCEEDLVPRPNLRDGDSDDWDDCVADLQFRNHVEYAVGHGVSIENIVDGTRVVGARTAWLPRATVRRVVTNDEVKGVVTGMEELAALADGKGAVAALGALPEAYGAWIAKQRAVPVDARTPSRPGTQVELLKLAEQCKKRIAEGISLLASNPEVLDSFRLANRAMALAARKRSPDRYPEGKQPEWRLFQLAFLLINLAGLSDAAHQDRQNVELIFFPTGGGKTEAYLGVIAFVLVLRRLRGQARPDRGLGVAVLLRYTLRLLTLDQLGRAATLICALDHLRREQPERLGSVRFSIGLWVGRSATANTLDDAARRITEYKNSTSKNAPSPFPLTACPWCQKPLTKTSLTLHPNRSHPTEVVVGCSDFGCDFAAARNREGIPVVFVDEQLYRELPSFIVATVDKFALLPWRGEAGMLFGRVHSRVGHRFFGPGDGAPARDAEALPEGLRPPELIVQDELHLISGPLGTMVGLYETAIEHLCRTGTGGTAPKLIASTATVRRAHQQVRSLFGRRHMAVFPPAGIDDSETFFAKVDQHSEGRLYLGVAASGRAMKAILLRAYVALLGAAERCHDPAAPPDQPADPYMTLVGYFNSLRELGGMRRLVEDEVRSRCGKNEDRRPVEFKGSHPSLRNREIQHEPVELTSRESTHRIADYKSRLGHPHVHEEHVDVLLASNMISVGVDIDRLGLMVVGGQPKSTSEYIQASSRVGRDPNRPGLVVTVFNLHKPRDRSHYERFTSYHECFYRFVEATSLTPFSGPALERGLAGVLVSMTRHSQQSMAPAAAVMRLHDHRAVGEQAVTFLAERGGRERDLPASDHEKMVTTLKQRGTNLLDNWESAMHASVEAAGERCYSPLDRDKKGKPLLHTILDEERPKPPAPDAGFTAPTSMRDVESSVHLWVERAQLTKREPNDGQ